LGYAGAEVQLITSRFAYGTVAPPDRYARRELFYRYAFGTPGGRVRMACKLAQHVPDMLRYRRVARTADVVHFQWLAVQHLDAHLLPSTRSPTGGHRPLVLTAHDLLPREPRPGQLAAQRRLYERFDAIVVHSEHGRARLLADVGLAPERVHVIPHGVLAHLADRPAGAQVTAPPRQTDKPVVLCFGLMRPYKGIEVLLDAWRGVGGETGAEREAPIEDAELWVVGMPRMDIEALRDAAPANVRFVTRFVGDDELAGYFERADLVVLPYLQADQSGVLFTALAFGKPLLLSDVGGFPEIAATGAARMVPSGDPRALGRTLRELLADPVALARIAERARDAASGPYSWDRIAARTLALYRSL